MHASTAYFYFTNNIFIPGRSTNRDSLISGNKNKDFNTLNSQQQGRAAENPTHSQTVRRPVAKQWVTYLPVATGQTLSIGIGKKFQGLSVDALFTWNFGECLDLPPRFAALFPKLGRAAQGLPGCEYEK